MQASLVGPPNGTLGIGDLAVVLKYRVAEHLPLVGSFAILPGLKVPAADASRGTTTTDVSLLLVSSHRFGATSLDVNLGYVRRSGDGRTRRERR